MTERFFLAIDLKSFYASVECVDRGLDPFRTHLVVADPTRTEKTICLAVSPALKAEGVSGRPRLFEVIERVNWINAKRRAAAGGGSFSGRSYDPLELQKKPSLALDYIIARPRMRRYLEVSSEIVKIYLRYVSIDDLHVYSVDEVFIDVTDYLRLYQTDAQSLARKMVGEVLEETGITATVGIGTNLYLCKIAMDIEAKKKAADRYGVRMAFLDEKRYRDRLWDHKPLTDFWRLGPGYAKRLAKQGLYTMRDIARCSLGAQEDYYNADLLYRIFGVQAELLIDHAWGRESCQMADIKAYLPQQKSIHMGQVLSRPYAASEGRLVLKEMAQALAMDLMAKGVYSKDLTLTISYDVKNTQAGAYQGSVRQDSYGRKVPVHAHGTTHLDQASHLASSFVEAFTSLYDRIVDPSLTIRKLSLVADAVSDCPQGQQQLHFFSRPVAQEAKEKRLQETILGLKKKYGKNSVLFGSNFLDGATMRERNGEIGGHRA